MSEMSISKERLEQFKQIVFNFLNASRGHGMYANYNGNPIHRLSEFAMLLYLLKNGKLHAVANVFEDDDNVLAMHSGRGLLLGDMHKEWNWKDIAHVSIVKDPFIKDEILIPIFDFFKFPKVYVKDYLIPLVKNGITLDDRQTNLHEPFYVDSKDGILAIYEEVDRNKYKPVLIFKEEK